MENIRSRIRRGYQGPQATRASRSLLAGALANTVLPQFMFVPENALLTYALIIIYGTYLIVFFGMPVFFHYDRKKVMDETSYTPNTAFYIGVFFAPISLSVVLLYFYYRGKAYEEGARRDEAIEE